MKKPALFTCTTLIILLFSLPGFAQKPVVSEVVKKGLKAKYPTATSVKWVTETETEFSAEIKLKDKTVTATFDPDGRWARTETVMSTKELPVPVTAGLKQSAAGFSVKSVKKVESPKTGVNYDFVIKKGKKNLNLVLTPDGLMIRKADLAANQPESKNKDKKKSAGAEADK